MVKFRLVLLSALFGFTALPYCFSEEPLVYDKITVTSRRDPPFLNSLIENYSARIETAEKQHNSLIDLLDEMGGLDLRYRGTFGIQGDLSVRGGTFEQAAVLIDGIRVMDPQTGHYNLDIPLTGFDIERVESIREGASALYGQGPLAGSVNFVIKRPEKRALNTEVLFGEHALFGSAISFSLPGEAFSSRASFERKVSKAARPNTDFEYKTASLYLIREREDLTADALVGYQKKDFGADSFYSNLFPEEEEHTDTLFFRTGLDCRLSDGALKNKAYFRKHRDKFVLNRNSPTAVNTHTTYVYGLSSQWSFPLASMDFLLGADAGADQIHSTNLGKHSRPYESLSLGLLPHLRENLTADIRLRGDYYQNWGFQESYNFGLSYFLMDKALKINGSAGHAYRIPTFTELYYADAANQGNPGLLTEEGDHFRVGLNFESAGASLAIDGFLRRGRNLIDWTRFSEAQAWAATNLGRVDYRGVELYFKLEPRLAGKAAQLKKFTFSYNYTQVDRQAAGFFSKYALDVLRHQIIVGIHSVILGVHCHGQASYNQRCFGETYFVGNFSLAKPFEGKGFICEPFLKIDNFTNTRYSEVGGVLLPGRWIKAGVKFEW